MSGERELPQEESFLPLRKRKSARDYDDEVIAGPSAPVAEPVVTEPLPKVKGKKRKIAFSPGLKDRIQKMREGGFDQKDFSRLVRRYGLNQVLALVGRDNEMDGKNIRDNLMQLTHGVLSAQAARYSTH